MNNTRPTTGNIIGEKMNKKTITITLTKEQEKIFLDRLEQSTWRITDKEATHLQRDYKNPSDWTKSRVEEAKKSQAKLDKEWELADDFLKQIKEQLKKEAV